jgi:hypothetical protein
MDPRRRETLETTTLSLPFHDVTLAFKTQGVQIPALDEQLAETWAA